MIKEDVLKDTPEENELIRKVYHTDARVTAMEGQLSTLTAGMSRIEAHLMEQPDNNYLGWLGILAALLFGVAEYVDMSLDPIRDTVTARGEAVKEFQEFKSQTHYELGVIHEWKRLRTEGYGNSNPRADTN